MIRPFLLGLAAVALPSTALAQLPNINIDFTGIGSGSTGAPSSAYGAASGVAGDWNEVDVNQQAGGLLTSTTLVDTGGVNAGVTLTLQQTAGTDIKPYSFDQTFTTGDDQALMDDNFYFRGPGSITFDGLAAGTYTVYVYSMSPDSSNFETSVEVVGGSGPQTVGGDFQNGFEIGTNYTQHLTTIAAGQPLLILTDVVNTFDAINGIQIIGGSGVNIGTNYCQANVNSSGAAGVMSAQGSLVVASNNFALTASSLPVNQFGIFLGARMSAFVPNGAGTSNGNICLGGQIGRFNRAGEILGSGAAGSYSLSVDLTNIPMGNGSVAVMAGETWFFQSWVRDGVGLGSNFTDGVEVTFQ